MPKHHVVTFYQIEKIHDHEKLSRDVKRFAIKNSLLGTFFSTPQGVNTTMSGDKEALEGLVQLLKSKFKLNLLSPKWSISQNKPFKRLRVRLKPRLLPLEGDFDPVLKRGEHLDAREWNILISDPETLIIDVRNDYETDIGTFKNSMIPNMKDFTEFPEFVDNEITNNNKKVAMFCTGGIRCEKASSYMIKKGFMDVNQLKGGVIDYLSKIPKKNSNNIIIALTNFNSFKKLSLKFGKLLFLLLFLIIYLVNSFLIVLAISSGTFTE